MTYHYCELKSITDAEFAALAGLYREAGWIAPGENCEFIRRVTAGSAVFVAVYDGERIIGMGRAISDGVSDAYIQDVAVLNAYRHQGIGGEIVRRIIAALEERHIDWIALVGEPGTESFYRGLGFTAKPGFMLWKLEK